MENIKLFAFIVAAVVVGEYLASALVWAAVIWGAPEVIMSVVVIVYAMLASVVVQFGLYVLLALVVGAALWLIYKNIMAAKRGK